MLFCLGHATNIYVCWYCQYLLCGYRYGFNSDGHEAVRERLKHIKVEGRHLGVNLGRNKDSVDATEDFTEGIKTLGEFADYIVINVSSPNTPGLRDMQGRQQLADLLDRVCDNLLCTCGTLREFELISCGRTACFCFPR